MTKIWMILLVVCLLLSGCSFWNNGSYQTVTPHEEQSYKTPKPVIAVEEYDQLQAKLEAMVESGTEGSVISLQGTVAGIRQGEMDNIIKKVCENNPFAVYGVKDIRYEFGASGGTKAVSIDILYFQNDVKGNQIKRIETEKQMRERITSCLNACEPRLVVYLDSPIAADYQQIVWDYAWENPQYVMEVPLVTVKLYPEEGEKQIAELEFSYQVGEDELRMLQGKVAKVFYSAFQHSSGGDSEEEKAEKLYDFLMNRYEYVDQTSITPAYSLLLQGTGDSRTIAQIYAAMCRQVKVSCQTVTGTRNGKSWTWNTVQMDGKTYHVDLSYCKDKDEFFLRTPEQMTGYRW